MISEPQESGFLLYINLKSIQNRQKSKKKETVQKSLKIEPLNYDSGQTTNLLDKWRPKSCCTGGGTSECGIPNNDDDTVWKLQ